MSLASILEQGVDSTFDDTLNQLANCSRRHARRVLDVLSSWCRVQCEPMIAAEVRSQLKQSMVQLRPDEAAYILNSRKTSAAKYMYYRALFGIVQSVPPQDLGEDVALNLENAAFNLFKSERPDDYIRKDLSNLLVDFLGELSNNRFLTVSERFTHEIGTLNAAAPKDLDARVEHILKGVRHLKLKVYPDDNLEMASEFLQTLSVFFVNAHGNSLKSAFAETFTHLLHPVIESATAEVNHPLWSKAVATVLQRAMVMASKPRYWNVAFPLVVVALSVSPREVFMEHWQACIDSISSKTKDRTSRAVGMNAFVRLLWVYLNRCPESSTSTRRRLEGLLRNHFPVNTGQLLPTDLPLDPFVAILHYVMARQFDFGQELVAEFLLDCVPPRAADGSAGEVMFPERAYVAVQAATKTLECLAANNPVSLPKSADFTTFDFDAIDCPNLPESIHNIPEADEFLKRCGPMIINVLLSCDRTVGSVLLSGDTVTIAAHASSAGWEGSGEQVTRKHGDVHVGYPKQNESTFRLLAAVLETLPFLLPTSNVTSSNDNIINILCRATFSADPMVCDVASRTMRRVAQDPEIGRSLVDRYRQFIFETRHVFRDHFIGTRLLESQLVRVVKVWVDVLETLATHQRSMENPVPFDAEYVNKVDGAGLFLLCSSSQNLRQLALPVFAAARDFTGEARGPSEPFRYSRVLLEKPPISCVLQMYEGTVEESDYIALSRLAAFTEQDRARLAAIRVPKLIQHIAESQQSKDAALWAVILPAFIGKVYDSLPNSVVELRSVLASTVVRNISHLSSVANSRNPRLHTNPSAVNRTTSDPAILADQWRLYFSVLCAVVDPTKSLPTPRKLDATMSPEVVISPAIFPFLIRVMESEDKRFQDAAVYSLGSIRLPALSQLSEALLYHVRRLYDQNGSRNEPRGQTRESPTMRRPSLSGVQWTAAAHVFRLVSPLIIDGRSPNHLANLSNLIGFVKITFNLLAEPLVQVDYDLQSLRRYFCIVVDNLSTALGQLGGSDRFFSPDTRAGIFKLCYDWCNVGRRPDIAKARVSHTLQQAADSYRGDDKAQYVDVLQSKMKLLSAASAEAMASLCLGRLISAPETVPSQTDHIVDPLMVLRWIRGMFQTSQSSNHDTARKALSALIKYNWDVPRLSDEVLHQSFGEGEHFSLDASFFGILADVISDGTIKLPPAQRACLSLSKLGHPVAAVRQRAFQLAVWLFDDPDDQLSVSGLLPLVGSAAPNVYRSAQLEMATKLANLYPQLAFPFLTECTKRLGQLEAPRRQATLSILPPFLKVLELEADTSELGPEEIALEHQSLLNIMYLVVRFSADHLDEVREILLSFAGTGQSRNTRALIKFLFEQGAKRGSPDFVQHAQQIIAALANSPVGDVIFEEICSFVHPSDMASAAQTDVPESPNTSLANLDALFTSTLRTKPLSQGQMALLFAGELLPHRLSDPSLRTRLPTLLHVAFIHCDDPNTSMRESAQAVLFQVLRAWISDHTNIQNMPPAERAEIWNGAEMMTNKLSRHKADLFWSYDDAGSSQTFAHAPTPMSTLLFKILGIFQQLQPTLRKQWGTLALNWATSCTIRHLACRSFQVFRVLALDITPRMVSDVLARLSSTIASSSPEIQAFNNELLRTFACIVRSKSEDEMRNFPQIFWCAVACLTTPYEAEFNEVVDLLSHILDKANLADPAVVSHLVSFRPSDLTGPPPHLQSLLLMGLRSSTTDMMTFDVLRRLTSVPSSELIDEEDGRLLHGFAAALPWMLHSTDLGEPNEELAGMATDLADIAERRGNASLARLLTSFARNRFRAKDDFIRQAAQLLRDFLKSQPLELVTILLGFTLNHNDWMREKSLQILKLVLAYPEAGPALSPHARELSRPLLRLVSTKHVSSALEVLDLPPFNNIDASGPDTTDPIFGPIESSGWSVPNASERSEVTRSNVQAVFNTCAVESRAASAHFSVLQFSDLANGKNGSNPNIDGKGHMKSVNASNSDAWPSNGSLIEMPSPPVSVPDNASMGDLVGALHSLNLFFDDSLDQPSNGTTSPLQTRRKNFGSFGRASSSESLAMPMQDPRVRAIMTRGTRSPTAHLQDSAYKATAAARSTESFATAVSDGYYTVPGEGPVAASSAPVVGGYNAYSSSRAGSRMGDRANDNLNVTGHAPHNPSFSSESEFDLNPSAEQFWLDEHPPNGVNGLIRPWEDERTRTPSPRDALNAI